MKTMKLYLTLALIGVFQMAQAQFNVHAQGQLTNTSGAAINVTLVLLGDITPTSVTVSTNPNGFYSHTFVANIDSGSVYMQVDDCNSDSIFEYQLYDLISGDTIANFTTFDYCPNVPPPTSSSVHASGSLTNTNSAAINVSLVLFDGSTTINATAVTDANGDYSHTFPVVATSQGTVYMQVLDCNSDSIFETKPYDLNVNDSVVNYTTFDYCPTIQTTCFAFFSTSQALDTNGVAIASQLIVTDSSGTTGAGNLTYTWDFGDGATGSGSALLHTYSGNGPYVLCLTIDDGQGCTDTYCDTISVDSLGMIESEGFTLNIGVEPTLSVEEIDFSSAVSIYPNPAVNIINIEFKTGDKALNRVTMYDLSGKVVFEENNNNSSNNMTTISTEGIAPGTYLIQMLFDNELHNEKVIIK